jgi:hypothetical protein
VAAATTPRARQPFNSLFSKLTESHESFSFAASGTTSSSKRSAKDMEGDVFEDLDDAQQRQPANKKQRGDDGRACTPRKPLQSSSFGGAPDEEPDDEDAQGGKGGQAKAKHPIQWYGPTKHLLAPVRVGAIDTTETVATRYHIMRMGRYVVATGLTETLEVITGGTMISDRDAVYRVSSIDRVEKTGSPALRLQRLVKHETANMGKVLIQSDEYLCIKLKIAQTISPYEPSRDGYSIANNYFATLPADFPRTHRGKVCPDSDFKIHYSLEGLGDVMTVPRVYMMRHETITGTRVYDLIASDLPSLTPSRSTPLAVLRRAGRPPTKSRPSTDMPPPSARPAPRTPASPAIRPASAGSARLSLLAAAAASPSPAKPSFGDALDEDMAAPAGSNVVAPDGISPLQSASQVGTAP